MAMVLTAIALPVTIWHIAFAPVAEAVGTICNWIGTDGANFSDSDNWDCGHVPTSEDDVIAYGGVTVDSDYTVLSLSVWEGGYVTGFTSTLTVVNGATFNNVSFNETPIHGNVTFSGTSENFSTITGDVTFNETAYINGGTVDGDVTFSASNITHDVLGGGSITGTVTFSSLTPVTFTVTDREWSNNATAWVFDTPGQQWIFNGTAFVSNNITGDATFNDSTYSIGVITGNATFNDTAYNGNSIIGNAVFTSSEYDKDPAINVAGAVTFTSVTPVTFTLGDGQYWTSDATNWVFDTPGPTWTFNGTAYNNGTIAGNVTFNDTSYNNFDISGNVTFNNESRNENNITGDTTFNGTSYNNSEITGNVTYNDTSYNNSDINGDVTFNGTSYNAGNINGDTTFNDTSYDIGSTAGNAIFNDSSAQNGGSIITGNTSFNEASSCNNGTTNGNVEFVGDNGSITDCTVTGTHTRTYVADTVTTRNFTTDGGYDTWIIVADGAVVDVSGATYGPGNDFQTLNNGSFTANGEIEGVEACDDGNVTAGDGCSATMTVEAGYACTGEPSACTVIPSSGGSSPAPTETQEQSGGGGRGSGDRTHPSPASPDKDPSQETTDTGDVGDVNDADDSSDSQEGAQESGANDRVRPAPVPSSNAVKRLTYGEVAKHLDLVLPPVKPAATDRQGRARTVGAAETAPRGAVIAMILERMAIPLEETRSPFTDVIPGSRDERAMATAWKLGLIRGDTDEQGNPKGTSRPHDPITQKEIQYIIDRIERLRRNGELEGL